MKKFFLILLALVFVFCLCACTDEPTPPVSQTPDVTDSIPPTEDPSSNVSDPVTEPPAPFTAPAGTVVCGVDVSGMVREEALTALTGASAGFTLTLDVSGQALTVPGESVGLAFDTALFDAYWSALEQGEAPVGQLHTVSLPDLEQILAKELEHSAKNPYVSYSDSQYRFVVHNGTNGIDYDVPAIAQQTAVAMSALASEYAISATGYEIAPTVRNDDPRLHSAADAANHYLTITLSYSFTNGMGDPVIEPLSSATVASFVRIDGDYSVSISRSAINNYASSLGSRYGGNTTTGDFITTEGTTVPFTVKYYGEQVNTTALSADIYTCLTTGISGVRTAEYLPNALATMPYGGSYVEIDLTAQKLWVYRNGQCVVSTPIVSGCVADENETPNGVFAIYHKAKDCWLVGPTWRDHVDYWMPFYGAYGLHDASWRSEFGGDIYIHEGSHGCPNMPVEIAGQVYDNVSIGTPVIVYGGLTEPVDLVQEISVEESYALSVGAPSFLLEYTLKYNEAEVTVTSDNPDVITVAEDGTVTVHNIGSANITVSAAAYTYHTAATATVRINVYCQPEAHTLTHWELISPTCESDGCQTYFCSICGYVETETLPATGHSFGEDGLCVNGCGTVDPTKDETTSEVETPSGDHNSSEEYRPDEDENSEEKDPSTDYGDRSY